MIQSKTDLQHYISADRAALGIKDRPLIERILLPNRIHDFQVTLRKAEYYSFVSDRKFFFRVMSAYYRLSLRRRSIKLGFTIPMNVFGPGLSIAHYGTIVVNPAAKVGKNCRLHVCVNIGASSGNSSAPQIGDDVYIAPGCKIFGDIKIADRTVISANSVVNRSFVRPGSLIGGVPAKVLKEDFMDFTWKSHPGPTMNGEIA